MRHCASGFYVRTLAIIYLFDKQKFFCSPRWIFFICWPTFLWRPPRVHIGPHVVFFVYPLGYIFRKHNISFNCYADDVKMYLLVKTNDKASFLALINCLRDFKTCLDLKFLCLNENKTEIVVFGHTGDLSTCVDALGNLGLYVRLFTRNLSVISDSAFKFEKRISSVLNSFFYWDCWLKSSPTCRVRSLKV